MAIDFKVKDIMHSVYVKFVHAFLPEAKKPYYLKTVHQPELDIHGIASKADVYNIQTSPKVIEEGLTAGMELIFYLVADGYKIKTPLFNLKIRVPGEYDGSETHLAHGVYARARLQTSADLRKFLEGVKVEFDGVDSSDGYIAEVIDEATGLVDEVATWGNILTIRGFGLKIDGDEAHQDEVGLFFISTVHERQNVKAEAIAVNEPRTIKVIVPPALAGVPYTIKIVTQSSAKGHSSLLKELREVKSDFTVTPQ
jgi:hypothetical protein